MPIEEGLEDLLVHLLLTRFAATPRPDSPPTTGDVASCLVPTGGGLADRVGYEEGDGPARPGGVAAEAEAEAEGATR